MSTLDTSIEVKNIFEKNKLDDLKAFIKKRNCLNSWNMSLIYLFHITQSAGILVTTIAAGSFLVDGPKKGDIQPYEHERISAERSQSTPRSE